MGMKHLLRATLGLVLALGFAATARAEDVTVFAAASTTNALDEIAILFKAKTGNGVRTSYASSSTLAKQVEQGAPAQVFISADLKWVDYLAERKLINADSRANLLGNTLVLIAPADSKLAPLVLDKSTDLVKLLGDGRLSTGDPDHVPAGIYARQALEAMGQWKAMEAKLARVDSVRAALALVERGETPLGIVYATDAAVTHKVKVVGTFPGTLHDPVVYPVALITGHETPAARAYLDVLKSSEAKGIFAKYGFKLN
ncbi:MAG: molybdate ABC transporter substrate-binding protein [Rhodospirillaceae bacterium]|nr:molybdate ABC transporter substrate-binding protein [Rhodospirillaceae bacterium]